MSPWSSTENPRFSSSGPSPAVRRAAGPINAPGCEAPTSTGTPSNAMRLPACRLVKSVKRGSPSRRYGSLPRTMVQSVLCGLSRIESGQGKSQLGKCLMDRILRLHALKALLLAGLFAAPAPASAQAASFEEAAATLGASCGKDIDDNCRGVNLDPTRLKDCLIRSQDVVSAQCKANYPKAFSAVQQHATARAGVFKVCERDAAKLCGGVQK